ncbi:MAG: beta-N-acetylglucosaminidase domain-containing protein, partial [Parachlamydia sp.]|nr:beta-N-acetylglucosaminidase domain-containing protein [Parachlamydia sp.]
SNEELKMFASSSSKPSFGVVEGFYWKPADNYHSQYGEYTHEQRRELLRFMQKKKLGVYAYDPKRSMHIPGQEARKIRSTTPLRDSGQWRSTFQVAKACGIDFIWGICCSTQDEVNGTRKLIDQLMELGASGVSLQYDDTLLKEERKDRACIQRKIQEILPVIQELIKFYPTFIQGICPPCDKGEPSFLESVLNEFHEKIPRRDIPFIFTVEWEAHWNHDISRKLLPRFKDRKLIFWDNWIAADSQNEGKCKPLPPPNRRHDLLADIASYWLNLCFPVERMYPIVSFMSTLQTLGRSPTGEETARMLDQVAEEWAEKLKCSTAWTRHVLKARFNNPEDHIKPTVEDIIDAGERGVPSLESIFKAGFTMDQPVKNGKTLLQLAAGSPAILNFLANKK